MAEIRLIDGNELRGIESLLNTDIIQASKEASWLMSQVLHDIDAMHTIAPETLPIVQELRKELERVTKERDEIATLCGKLGVLCDQPQKKRQELFLKYRGSMIGDYMGSGYPFVDAFNRIIDDFMLTMSDGAYKAVMEAANKEIQSKRKPLEVQKDE